MELQLLACACNLILTCNYKNSVSFDVSVKGMKAHYPVVSER